MNKKYTFMISNNKSHKLISNYLNGLFLSGRFPKTLQMFFFKFIRINIPIALWVDDVHPIKLTPYLEEQWTKILPAIF